MSEMSRKDPTLRMKQSLFLLLESRLVLWVKDQGWALTPGEGLVAHTDAKDGDHDGPHKAGGAHYTATGEDVNLFVGGTWTENGYEGGQYIADGSHPAWLAIGLKWESYHPLCFWGGRIRDANHISIRHGNRA